jgi:hypothetical protein
MFRIIITKLWPALIPIGIFLIWKIINKKYFKHLNFDQKRERFILLLGILISLIFSLLLFAFSESRNASKIYVPAKIENGKIKPAIIK